MNAHDSDKIYPADIAPVAAAVDDLAEADRRASPNGLERRLARASWKSRSTGLRLTSERDGQPRWLARPSMRLAASVAVVAGGLAAWVAMQPAGRPAPDTAPSLEQEVDAWLALAGPDDGLRAEIETMLLQSADLARGLNSGWLEDELIGESL